MADEGGDEKLLSAFVEFSQKGMQGIFDAAAAIKRALENADFQKAAEVVFSAKGGETVKQQARDMLREETRERDYDFRERMRTERIEADANVRQRLAEERKVAGFMRAEYARVAREYAKEMTAGAPDPQMTWVEMLGQGFGLRRIIASAITGAFGDSKGPLAEMIGGIGGMLGNLMVLKMAWGFENMLVNLPGIVGEQVTLARYAGVPESRASTGIGGAAWNEMLSQNRHWWGHYRVGEKGDYADKVFQNVIQKLQQVGVPPASAAEEQQRIDAARDYANQAIAMSLDSNAMVKDPAAFATAMMTMRFGIGDEKIKAKLALLNDPQVMARMIARYRQRPEYAHRWTDAGLASLIRQHGQLPDELPKVYGAVTGDELANVVSQMLTDPRVKGSLERQTGQIRMLPRSGFGLWYDRAQLQGPKREYVEAEIAFRKWKQAQENVVKDHPILGRILTTNAYGGQTGLDVQRRYGLTDEQIKAMEPLIRGETKGFQAIPGLGPTEEMKPHFLTPHMQYGFTSLAGLAEQMQALASQQLDIPQQQLGVLKEINSTLRERLPITPTPISNHPGKFIPGKDLAG